MLMGCLWNGIIRDQTTRISLVLHNEEWWFCLVKIKAESIALKLHSTSPHHPNHWKDYWLDVIVQLLTRMQTKIIMWCKKNNGFLSIICDWKHYFPVQIWIEYRCCTDSSLILVDGVLLNIVLYTIWIE